MTFYLKYRPQLLDDLDLDSVREQLTKVVSSGNIPHAFLFAGPKGTGKTSAARIVAKIVNCERETKRLSEPCNKCDECKSIMNGSNIDVIELDAASNRGIDDVRALRDTIKLSPAKSKKKVYIIDEAHMLTLEASNALLKTLEEPPSHVIFILATTNPEKLIETIRSRTTLIEFHKATPEETVRSLNRVVKGEKIKADKDALLAISKFSKGSFRDATKVLEQLVSEKIKLEKGPVEEYLFKSKSFDEKNFLDLLEKKDVKKLLYIIKECANKGVGAESIIETLLAYLRESLLAKVGVGEVSSCNFSKDEIISLIELLSNAYSQTPLSPIEELPLEVVVIRWCGNEEPKEEDIKDDGPKGLGSGKKEEAVEVGKKKESKSEEIEDEEPKKNLTARLSEITEEVWKKILTQVRPINTSIEALLRAAKPVGYDGSNLTLGVYYRFHKERLEEVSHRKILEDVAASILGSPIRVTCTLTEAPKKPIEEVPKEVSSILTDGKDNDIIKAAEEIFGN